MAPVILMLRQDSFFDVKVLASAQHREMLDQVLSVFGVSPDFDLDAMRPDQTLAELTSRLVVGLDEVIAQVKPDMVLAQGDTTTVLASALASFYRQVSFGHVEAGLRTGDMRNPYPEEMNRVLAGHVAAQHFAPTETARENLLREGIADGIIHVTGNTVIDALLDVAKKDIALDESLDPRKRLVLVTAHRRENFGEPFRSILRAIRGIVNRHPDVQVLYPVHPNPNVREVAHRELSDCERVVLCEPLDYGRFVAAMKRAHLILTDSGGVQEEAPALGKPVLVLRTETERPEAVDAGVVKLVGLEQANIEREASRLLEDPVAYRAMAKGVSPYGDGMAAQRIGRILRELLADRDNVSATK